MGEIADDHADTGFDPDDYDHNQEFVYALYDGFILKVTEKALGLGTKTFRPGKARPKVEIWLPKSQLRTVTYGDGGDMTKYKEGKRVEAVQIPRWLAKEKGLEIDD